MLTCNIETIVSFLPSVCLQQAPDVEVGTDLVPSVTVKVLYNGSRDCDVHTIVHISSCLSLLSPFKQPMEMSCKHLEFVCFPQPWVVN